MKRKWVLHIIGQYIIHDSLHQITGYINLCMSTANRQYIFFLISQYTFIHVLYTTGMCHLKLKVSVNPNHLEIKEDPGQTTNLII